MRKVRIERSAAKRWQRSLPRLRTGSAGGVLAFLGLMLVSLHGVGASGSLTGAARQTPGAPISIKESRMSRTSSTVAVVATCAIASATSFAQHCDELVVWGDNSYGALDNIPQVPMRAVSSNYHLSVGLDASGQIHCWGAPDVRASIPSRIGIVQVAAGNNWALARDLKGTIIAWGDNSKGQCEVPDDLYADMDCGDWHTVAVTTTGNIRCWGDNAMGACNAPPGVFASVGAGSWHSLAITPSGGVVGWGFDVGQLQPPAKIMFLRVVGGWKHSLGIDSNGSIHGWGTDIGGVLTQIPTNGAYIEIDCSASRGIALRDDGRVVT